MKCLVTGASGFIGRNLFTALESRGYEVIQLPHKLLGERSVLDAVIRNSPPLDLIFHLAAYGNMAHHKDNVYQTLEANYLNTYQLLSATKDSPYRAFINVSSSSVLLPHQTLYSATKAGGEFLCRAYADEYDKPIASVRPTSVYGSGEANFRFIPTVFRSCLTGEPMTLDPDAGHDWIYIDDLVDRMLTIADTIEAVQGQSVNFGTNKSTQNKVVVELIEMITGKRANITEKKRLRSFDDKAWIIDSPVPGTTSLEEGLQKYYDSIK